MRSGAASLYPWPTGQGTTARVVHAYEVANQMRVCRRKDSGEGFRPGTYPRTSCNETGRRQQVAVAPRKRVGWLHSAPFNRADVEQVEQPNPVSGRSIA